MSEQFEYKGFLVEVDQDHPEGPLMKVGDKKVPVQKIGTQYVVAELPYSAAETLSDLVKELVNQSREFVTSE